MSEKIPVWSWTDAVAAADVPPNTKFVCLNIARYLSSAGKGWRITIKQMMKDTGLSNRALATHLENARKAGLLDIEREHDKNGRRIGTTYTPCFPHWAALPKGPAEVPPPSEGGSLRQGTLSEGGSSTPSEGTSRQVSSQKKLPNRSARARACDGSPEPTLSEEVSEAPAEDDRKRTAEDAFDDLPDIAPGWDRYWLLQKFREWPESKKARNEYAAFLGWVKSFIRDREPEQPGDRNMAKRKYVKVLRGTPQWDAWLEHYRSRPECKPYLPKIEQLGLMEVPDKWPPGHEQSKPRRTAA